MWMLHRYRKPPKLVWRSLRRLGALVLPHSSFGKTSTPLRMTYRTFILLYALDKSEGLPRHSKKKRISVRFISTGRGAPWCSRKQTITVCKNGRSKPLPYQSLFVLFAEGSEIKIQPVGDGALDIPKTNGYHKINNQKGIPCSGRPILARFVWSVKVYTLFSFIRHSVFSPIRLQFSPKNDIMSIEKKHV